MTDPPHEEPASPAEPSAGDDELDGSERPPSEPRRRGRWLVAVLVAGLVVVLAAGGVVGTRIIGVWGSDPEPTPEATASPEPTEPPSPFDGTPAENFAEGATGIVLPEAEAVGDFTADEVADALEQVRDALVAARLDQLMLVEHDPKPFLQLLAPDHRSGRRAEFKSGEFGAYATQLTDGTTLAAVPPRVDGRVSYEIGTAGARDTEVIEVVSRSTWVYAFETVDSEATGQLVVIRDELVWTVRLGQPWLESSRGLWLERLASRVWGADCDEYEEDGVLRPDAEAPVSTGEAADEIFDPEQSLNSDDIC